MKLSRRKIELVLVDIAIIVCVYYMTYLVKLLKLRSIVLNGEIDLTRLLALVGAIMAGRIAFGVYRNIWRYANIQTYLTIMVSDFVSNFVLMLIGRFCFAVNLGIGVHMIVAMAILLVTLLSRYCYQLLYAHRNKNTDNTLEGNSLNQLYKVEVAIVGAGNVGATLADEFFRNPRARYVPVCFIDTDPQKVGQTVNGVPIYPEGDSTMNLLKKMKVREIIIALPDLTVERKQKLYERYRNSGCTVKIYDYPSRTEDNAPTKQRKLRDFRIEDLLFRDAIEVENPQTRAFYEGKTVLVTGGCYGIGFAIATAFHEAGAKIVFNDINQELVDRGLASYKEIGIDAKGYVCDVTNEEQVTALAARIREEVGVIDILVNNAGLMKRVPMIEMSHTDFLRVIDVHVGGAFNCSKAVLPDMIAKREGKIINICSMMSELGRETVSAYAAAKGRARAG